MSLRRLLDPSTYPVLLLAFATFAGTASGQLVTTSCTIVTGSTTNPNSGSIPCTLNLIDSNHFTIQAGGGTLNFTRTSVTPALFSFSGTWTTSDYVCGSTSIAESVQIGQVNNIFQATKITGDGCVTAGHTTFYGTFVSTVTVNRSALYFGVRLGGASTPAQQVSVTVLPNTQWTASSSTPNIVVAPTGGTGPGFISVSATSGASGTVTVSAGNQSATIAVAVNTLPVIIGNPTNPTHLFGSIDQPGPSQTTGFAGAIPVTGWALDDIGVSRVSLYREPVSQDSPGSIAPVLGMNLVYIGDAIFLPDTRPDVAASYPGSPLNYRGGWGMLFLTNTTLNNNGTAGAGGNGIYILHIIGTNVEGYQYQLGTRTITVDNVHAVLPFGTIDTPAQGQQNVTGTQFVNFGWALTNQPNLIPTDGSTMFVSLDGARAGAPTYGYPRTDIDSLFPGYQNTGKAVGYFYINMTTLISGIHSIAWSVRDSGGNLQGIGSRVFYVNNPGGPVANQSTASRIRTMGNTPRHRGRNVLLRRGPDFDAPLTEAAFRDGQYHVDLTAGERLELHTGRALRDAEKQSVPACSTLDAEAGIFHWQPPIMALGEFTIDLQTEEGELIRVNVSIKLPPAALATAQQDQ